MHFDLTPLYKTTVGYDRFARLLDTMSNVENAGNSYPPYNIERLGENEYRISMAVAGFGEDDLNIEVKEHTLTVTGSKTQEQSGSEFLHQGIAARNFERRFHLPTLSKSPAQRLKTVCFTSTSSAKSPRP